MTRACGTSSFFSQYTTLIHPIDCLLSPKGDKRLAKLRSWIPWGDGPLSWMAKRYPHLFGTRRLQESDISCLDFAFRREKLFWKISGNLKGVCVWTAN